MFEIANLVTVFPCHALEDFPVHETGENAAQLLASWTAMWHPSLVAAANSVPTWISNEFVNRDIQNSLICAPRRCAENLPAQVVEAVDSRQALLVVGAGSRESILQQPLVRSLLDVDLDQELVADFFALGYAFLQVQLMTRQLRYSSTLELEMFNKRVILAAQSCLLAENTTTKESLASCFDLLLEERNNFYPTDPHLLNLVLVEPGFRNLRQQLQVTHKFNLMLDCSSIRRLQENFPEEIDSIRHLIQHDRVGVVLDGFNGLPTPLVSMESVLNQLNCSTQAASDCLGKFAETFGCYQFGLNPQIPSLMEQYQFESAIHITFSGGQIPTGSSPVINWQGHDGTNIPALAVTSIDANSPDAFLKLGITIGEMLDGYHHAELLFVHWPNQTAEWFEDLRRIEKYGSLFGKFMTFSQFNGTVYDSGFSDSFSAEDYRFDYLDAAWRQKIKNPVSKWQVYWRSFYRLQAHKTLATLVEILQPGKWDSIRWFGDAVDLLSHLENAVCSSVFELFEIESKINHFIESCEQFVEHLPSETIAVSHGPQRMFINPSTTKTSRLIAKKDSGDGETKTVSFAAFDVATVDRRTDAVAQNDPPVLNKQKHSKTPVLRNEIFEIQFDPETGGVRSVNRHEKKGNLFSQQLACRLSRTVIEHGHNRQKSRYSRMVVDHFETVLDCQHAAGIKSCGGLYDHDQALIAKFEQSVFVERCSNQIKFEVVLNLQTELTGNPWRNYVASRLAWPAEDAEILKSENEIAEKVHLEKFVAPNFVEIRTDHSKVSILPAGLPFHRRSGRRMLDSPLVVEGENQRRFRFAVAVDAVTSIQAAIAYQSPCFEFVNDSGGLSTDGWLFHLNCKNVVVTNLEPVRNESGQVTGAFLRLQETEGRSGELRIACPFQIQNAERCDFRNSGLFDLQFENDSVYCHFLEFQKFQVKLVW